MQADRSPFSSTVPGLSGKTLPVALLAAILAAYSAWAVASWSATDFGYLHDDSLYLSSARSIADGNGYLLPSVPFDPLRSKYPVGYPFLLSLLWRIEPRFPAVLTWVFAAHIALGWGFLIAAYLLFRQLGRGSGSSLALTGLCAIHPGLIDVTRLPLSDLPFMLLALASTVSAERALRDGTPRHWFSRWWAVATVLSALAILTRSVAAAVVAGIFVSAVARRAPKPAAVYASLCAAVFLGSAYSLSGGGITSTGRDPGFYQTMLFYTDYLGFWRFSVPDWPTLAAQIEFNGMQLIKAPAYLCLFLPVLGFASGALQTTGVVVSVGIVHGAVRGLRRATFHPVMGAFVCYLPVVLLWNYSLMDRFLLLFVPLLYYGVAREVGSLLAPAREAFRSGGETGQRIAASLLSILIVTLLSYASYQCLWEIPAGKRRSSESRAAAAEQKQQAYDWIRKNSQPDDRLIAYEDAILFLETGRHGLRPIAPSTASFYLQSREALQADIDRLADTAIAIGARYWLVASDDYQLEHADTFLRDATSDLLRSAPITYQTEDGAVRIHDISAGL